jgi:hypothetical protein
VLDSERRVLRECFRDLLDRPVERIRLGLVDRRLLRVADHGARVRRERALRLERLTGRAVPGRESGVRPLLGDRPHPRTARGDERRHRPLGRRLDPRLVQGVEAALEGDCLPAEQPDDDLQPFGEPAHPVVVRKAERPMLGLVVPAADPQNQPAARHPVERGGQVRHQAGPAERRARDDRPDLHAGSHRRDCREHRPGVLHAEVVGDPHRVDARGFGHLGDLAELGPRGRTAADGARADRQADPQFHAAMVATRAEHFMRFSGRSISVIFMSWGRRRWCVV